MSTISRIRFIAFAVIGLALGAILVIYLASEWKLQRTFDVPLSPLRTDLGPANLAEGQRMAQILGCWAGCHGKEGQGGSIDMAGYYSVTAPTLSSVVPQYTDPELVRLIRFGIKRDGRSALGMISYTFYPLGDADLANVIAFLRTQPTQPAVLRHRTIEFGARLTLLRGSWQLAADQVDATRPRWGELPRTTPFERGRYLASITCSECHGINFRGSEFSDNTTDAGPSLAIVAIYGPDEFRKLLHTGASVSGRDLGEMAWVARNGFVHFTDDEVSDLYVFLRRYHKIEPE